MNKFLENVMNFINENTTLLIIICAFLILVLIGYLIDNSVKTRRLAKLEATKRASSEDETVIENKIVEESRKIEDVNPVVEQTTVEEPEVAPEEVTPLEETTVETYEAPVEETTTVEEEVPVAEEESSTFENTIEVPVVPIDIPTPEEITEPVEVRANEFTIDPKMNELLSRDFTKENNNYAEEEVKAVEVKEEPKVEEVKPAEDKNKYKNSKSLSEILAAKKTNNEPSKKEADLMNTVDFQHELDRLLNELNKETYNEDRSSESNLEETQDFTNMF